MSKSLVEKYRPKTLDEMIGNPEITKILKNLNSSLPNLLFYGPPGTGKTSAIKILCKNYETLELNASDDRGIDTVRNQIKEFCTVSSTKNRLVILDEVDSMSRDAQNALRRIIEDTNTRFCLIGNYVNKIIQPIQSRCTRFRFSPIKSDDMKR
ncbi:Replication factor C subunit 3 [Dictyocoela muelleri]|nr:Replication factor C subunit 3 [Dictyocoela muelleri]